MTFSAGNPFQEISRVIRRLRQRHYQQLTRKFTECTQGCRAVRNVEPRLSMASPIVSTVSTSNCSLVNREGNMNLSSNIASISNLVGIVKGSVNSRQLFTLLILAIFVLTQLMQSAAGRSIQVRAPRAQVYLIGLSDQAVIRIGNPHDYSITLSMISLSA